MRIHIQNQDTYQQLYNMRPFSNTKKSTSKQKQNKLTSRIFKYQQQQNKLKNQYNQSHNTNPQIYKNYYQGFYNMEHNHNTTAVNYFKYTPSQHNPNCYFTQKELNSQSSNLYKTRKQYLQNQTQLTRNNQQTKSDTNNHLLPITFYYQDPQQKFKPKISLITNCQNSPTYSPNTTSTFHKTTSISQSIIHPQLNKVALNTTICPSVNSMDNFIGKIQQITTCPNSQINQQFNVNSMSPKKPLVTYGKYAYPQLIKSNSIIIPQKISTTSIRPSSAQYSHLQTKTLEFPIYSQTNIQNLQACQSSQRMTNYVRIHAPSKQQQYYKTNNTNQYKDNEKLITKQNIYLNNNNHRSFPILQKTSSRVIQPITQNISQFTNPTLTPKQSQKQFINEYTLSRQPSKSKNTYSTNTSIPEFNNVRNSKISSSKLEQQIALECDEGYVTNRYFDINRKVMIKKIDQSNQIEKEQAPETINEVRYETWISSSANQQHSPTIKSQLPEQKQPSLSKYPVLQNEIKNEQQLINNLSLSEIKIMERSQSIQITQPIHRQIKKLKYLDGGVSLFLIVLCVILILYQIFK